MFWVWVGLGRFTASEGIEIAEVSQLDHLCPTQEMAEHYEAEIEGILR